MEFLDSLINTENANGELIIICANLSISKAIVTSPALKPNTSNAEAIEVSLMPITPGRIGIELIIKVTNEAVRHMRSEISKPKKIIE